MKKRFRCPNCKTIFKAVLTPIETAGDRTLPSCPRCGLAYIGEDDVFVPVWEKIGSFLKRDALRTLEDAKGFFGTVSPWHYAGRTVERERKRMEAEREKDLKVLSGKCIEVERELLKFASAFNLRLDTSEKTFTSKRLRPRPLPQPMLPPRLIKVPFRDSDLICDLVQHKTLRDRMKIRSLGEAEFFCTRAGKTKADCDFYADGRIIPDDRIFLTRAMRLDIPSTKEFKQASFRIESDETIISESCVWDLRDWIDVNFLLLNDTRAYLRLYAEFETLEEADVTFYLDGYILKPRARTHHDDQA